MAKNKNPRFPIYKMWRDIGRDGYIYETEISINKLLNIKRYPPEGVKALFKLFAVNRADNSRELIMLIDNHPPLGFHEHDKLPTLHNSRQRLDSNNWQETWKIFEEKKKRYI